MRAKCAIACLSLAAAALTGCGGEFKLPTETAKNQLIPSDESYQMVATWSGMTGVADILLTQGSGTQLFVLFNRGGSGTAPRGEILSYPRLRPTGTPAPIPGIEFATVFNPVSLCSGGDGVAGTNNRVFVLDRGDSCLARANPQSGACNDTTGGFNLRVTNLQLHWRVREYGLLGGDTLSTFADTTVAFVNGVAADAQGRVYVSGLAIILVPDQQDPRRRTRTFQWRVYRYNRGPRYPGVFPPDRFLPGANWHRDSTWVVEEGSGVGTVVDARGMFWGPANSSLYVADFNKNWVQKLSVTTSSSGFFQIDGAQSGVSFNGPVDVTADLLDFLYVADTGNGRVLRYDGSGIFVQLVNIEPDAFGEALAEPVAIAANDSLVYVGDALQGRVIRYQRRR